MREVAEQAMIIEIVGTCQYEGCDKPATRIACGRNGWNNSRGHPIPACYCDDHATHVADEMSPEYFHECPNCGCTSGVN